MNKYLKRKRAVGLIIVLALLLAVSTLAFAILVLFRSQHGVTYSFKGLDEIRYAEEMGFRHGLWVWRYRYGDLQLNLTGNFYETDPLLSFDGTTVESVYVRVEDKNHNRKLDEDEIEIQVNKKAWNP